MTELPVDRNPAAAQEDAQTVKTEPGTDALNAETVGEDHPSGAESPLDNTKTEASDEDKPVPRRKKLSSEAVKLVQNFAACGRCSFFLTGYRVLQGEEGLETAVSQQKGDDIPLVWTYAMRDLVARSYGTRFDGTYLHLNGSCPECRRPFTYEQNLPDDTHDEAGHIDPPRESFTIQYQNKTE